MKFYNILLSVWLVCVFLVIASCKHEKDIHQNQEVVSDVLIHNEKGLSTRLLKSSSYRNNDMVTQLFNDAIKHDEKLSRLNDSIKALDKTHTQYLKPYYEYFSNNDSYWKSAKNHIDNIEDSVLRKSMRQFFEKAKMRYEAQIKEHKIAKQQLDLEKAKYRDQKKILQLLVSQRMLETYNDKKRPDIETIQELTTSYKKLISSLKNHHKREQ